MSELQTDDSGITYDGPKETLEASNEVISESNEPDNAGVDLATTSPVEGEENTDSQATIDGVQVEGPEGFKKAIDKQHFKFREQERRANDLEAKLKALEEKNQPSPIQDVVIPSLPDDRWADDYEEQLKKRDMAIAQNARNAAIKSQQNEATAQRQQQEQIDTARNKEKLNTNFIENANKLGVNMEALRSAQNTVVDYGLSAELANNIITDSDGPIIIQYLAANPLDLHELVNGSQFKAGQKWADIKAKSSALKPKTSSTPKPTTNVTGSGAGTKERGPKGATFE